MLATLPYTYGMKVVVATPLSTSLLPTDETTAVGPDECPASQDKCITCPSSISSEPSSRRGLREAIVAIIISLICASACVQTYTAVHRWRSLKVSAVADAHVRRCFEPPARMSAAEQYVFLDDSDLRDSDTLAPGQILVRDNTNKTEGLDHTAGFKNLGCAKLPKLVAAASGASSFDVVTKHAMRVCASLNYSSHIDEGQRLGMIDSGCNSLILKLDSEVMSIVTDMNTSDAITGSSASSQFSTAGSGTVGIRCMYTDADGNDSVFEEVAKASFAKDWNFDLFSTKWFQKLGHSVIFNGRQSLHDTSKDGYL